MGFYYQVRDQEQSIKGLIYAVEHEADAEMNEHAQEYFKKCMNNHNIVLVVELDELSGIESLCSKARKIYEDVRCFKTHNEKLLNSLGLYYNMEKTIINLAHSHDIPVISMNSLTEHLLLTSKPMVENIQKDVDAMKDIPESSYQFQKQYILRRLETFKQGDEQTYWNSLMSGIPVGVREEYFGFKLKHKNALLAEKLDLYLSGFQDFLPLILCHMSNMLGEHGIGNALLNKSWEIIWDEF